MRKRPPFIHHTFWTTEEEEKLKIIFDTIPFTKMVNYFPNRTKHMIKSKAYSMGLRSKNFVFKNKIQYTYNENYWNNLSLSVCRDAGLVASDGCLYYYKPGNNKKCAFSLTLAVKDKEEIINFAKRVEFNGTIHQFISKEHHIQGHYVKPSEK